MADVIITKEELIAFYKAAGMDFSNITGDLQLVLCYGPSYSVGQLSMEPTPDHTPIISKPKEA